MLPSGLHDVANNNDDPLNELSDAATHTVLHFATVPPPPMVTAFRAGATRAAKGVPLEMLPFHGEARCRNDGGDGWNTSALSLSSSV
jgi:hypothetical protein